MPKIIINADDFGLSENINLGIIEAAKKGKLKSVSVVTCGRFFSKYIKILKDLELDLGVHLTITQESPLTEPKKIHSIVNSSGKFFDMHEFIWRYFCGKIDFGHIYLEWINQIQNLIRHDIIPIHMDGHQHLHILPGIIKIAKRLKSEYNIEYMRYEPLEPISLIPYIPRKLPFILTKVLCRALTRFRSSDSKDFGFLGIGFSGGLLKLDTLERIFRKLNPPDFLELNLHPGLNRGEGIEAYLDWRYDWERDLRLLCDGTLEKLLLDHGYQISSFKELRS